VVLNGPVHRPGAARRYTTANVDEALPGVLTPLTWSYYYPNVELTARSAWHDLGAMTARERPIPDDVDGRFFTAVLGHAAINLDQFAAMADRMPGGSGAAMEAQFFGHVQERVVVPWRRRVRRWPAVAVKAPRTVRRAMRTLEPLAAETTAWWSRVVADPDALRGEHALAVLVEGRRRFERVLATHLVLSMVGQGVLDRVAVLAGGAGLPGLERELIKSARGTAEFELVRDLRRLAEAEIELPAFLGEHGYHGSREGMLESRSWREEPAPVLALAGAYRRRTHPESTDELLERRGREQRHALARLEDALGPVRSRPARALVAFSAHLPVWRETGRASILRTIDAGRAAARGLGHWLVTQRLLDDPADVSYLTVDELAARTWDRDLVTERRAQAELFESVTLPAVWRGEPELPPGPVAELPGSGITRLPGLGVSSGVAEGVVEVVSDQDDADLPDGSVLVCRSTDPSWASLFPLVRAVVTDVGSVMSHAAIVCRELGLPCVAGTRTGSTSLRTGMRVRVDGDAGVVEVLSDGEGDR
jgi:pyruvate,water dikinase